MRLLDIAQHTLWQSWLPLLLGCKVCVRGKERGKLVMSAVCWGVQDAVKLYCLCKLPHDGERPMLQCDACRDWFHWDCVGLTPPGDDEDDEEVAPADFQCPACCIKVRIFGSRFLPSVYQSRVPESRAHQSMQIVHQSSMGQSRSQKSWRPRAGCPCRLCAQEACPQLP